MANRKGNVLVVEDDPKTLALIQLYLERNDFEVSVARNGTDALQSASERVPDLIVLDIMLPEVDGLTVCRRIREQTDTPIIMLTARTSEPDRLAGFDSGADDYVTKPFSPRELVSRVRAVLRRSADSGVSAASSIRLGNLVIDTNSRIVLIGSDVVDLTPSEFALLARLASRPGRVFTRHQLAQQTSRDSAQSSPRSVDVHILNLRRKLDAVSGTYGQWIQTVYGVGYRFSELEPTFSADVDS